MTIEEARAVTMPFGKHKGKALGDIMAADEDGASYIQWLAELDDIKSKMLAEAVEVLTTAGGAEDAEPDQGDDW